MNLLGIPIGFYGYLFPGNINLMVLSLYREGRMAFLTRILILILFFESLYCFSSLYLLSFLSLNKQWLHIIEILAYTLTLIMGIWMIVEKNKGRKSKQGTVYRGILSIIIHPQQIPFWLFVGVLFQHLSLRHFDPLSLLQFVFFNAVGTLIILLLYAFYGNKLLTYFKLNIHQINKTVGVIYILLSLSYFFKQF
jgi:small neutral amino acid transporter SnatA (MarC family)